MPPTTPPLQPHLQNIHNLLTQGYPHQLLVRPQTPLTLKIPALIACNLYDDAISQILNQQLGQNQQMCPLHLVWLCICCHMVQTQYQQYLEKLDKDDGRYGELVREWVKMYKPVKYIQEIKNSMRKKFEQLLLQAQQQSYYTNQRMPVFLVPTSWLQKFYSPSLSQIPGIDTTQLYTPSPYIQSDPKYMHYNYNINENCKQNVDYKIISYQAWQYLYSNFGGTQFRRFTTNQKQAICQIMYHWLKIVVVEDRYLFGMRVFQLFVGRFDTIAGVVQRVKKIMVDYGIIQQQSLILDWVPLLVSHMSTQQLFDIIQDQQRDIISQASPTTHKIIRLQPTTDIEDSEYSQKTDILLLSLHKKQGSQSDCWIDLQKISTKASTKKYSKCLTCSSTQLSNLEQCICKQAYFCSKQCRNKNKDHIRICENLMKEQSIINRLVDSYGINKRKMKWLFVKKGGKVGLENLGNTCYMNAALQCVLSVQDMNAFFTTNRHIGEINVNNVLGSGGELACAYGEFVKDYYTTNRKALEPIKILKIISGKNSQFRGHNHQDSQQFFNYFFDKLHEDMNRVRDKPYVENIQSDGRPDDIVSELSWNNYVKRNSSFISDNFAGQYRSQIKCPDCSRVSITFDPFLSVTLPFPRQEVQEQLVGYFLSGDGQFRKIEKKVRASMPAEQFVNKFFNQPVYPLWLRKKQPEKQWKMKKSVSINNDGKGVLIFYSKPQNSTVQLQVKYQGYDIFHRKIFITNIPSELDLMRELYRSIKVPLLKATKKQQLINLTMDEYLKKCEENNFIEIIHNSIKQYPVVKGTNTLKIKINEDKCPFKIVQKIKFDFSSGPYPAKSTFPTSRALTDSITLPELLKSFSQPEELTEQNSWYCNKCKDHKLAQKIMSLYDTGKYLVVHLKRFNHKGNRYVIYGEKVRMPVKLQDFEVICGKKYRLFGVVNHYGSLSMGHYTAYVNRENQWYYADDSSFRKKQLDGSDAYLLFYQCVEQEGKS